MLSRGLKVALSVALVVIAIDQATKVWAEATLTEHIRKPLIGSLLQLHLLYNPGAAFSMFTNATWVFAIFSTVICCLILFNAYRVVHPVWQLAIGGVLGGAGGNLIDRLTNEPGFGRGLVVDFLELPYWPVFNIADSAVVVSACVMVLMSFRGINFDGTRISDDKSKNEASSE
jgi:signal peptidase II